MAVKFSACLKFEKLASDLSVWKIVPSRVARLDLAVRVQPSCVSRTDFLTITSNFLSSYLYRSSGDAASCPQEGVEFAVANDGERRSSVS